MAAFIQKAKDGALTTADMEQALQPIIVWTARIMAIVAFIAFFLPYGSVSCQGEKIVELSLYDMGAGMATEYYEHPGDPSVFLLLIIPAASLILSLFKEQVAHITAWCIHGAMGAASLISNGSIFRQFKAICGENLCTAKGEIGHTLMVLYGVILLVVCLAGVTLNIYNRHPATPAKDTKSEE